MTGTMIGGMTSGSRMGIPVDSSVALSMHNVATSSDFCAAAAACVSAISICSHRYAFYYELLLNG